MEVTGYGNLVAAGAGKEVEQHGTSHRSSSEFRCNGQELISASVHETTRVTNGTGGTTVLSKCWRGILWQNLLN